MPTTLTVPLLLISYQTRIIIEQNFHALLRTTENNSTYNKKYDSKAKRGHYNFRGNLYWHREFWCRNSWCLAVKRFYKLFTTFPVRREIVNMKEFKQLSPPEKLDTGSYQIYFCWEMTLNETLVRRISLNTEMVAIPHKTLSFLQRQSLLINCHIWHLKCKMQK